MEVDKINDYLDTPLLIILNYPEKTVMKIPLVDLRAQYQNIKKEINRTIQNVINESAIIGAGFGVTKDILEPEIYTGNPVKSPLNKRYNRSK